MASPSSPTAARNEVMQCERDIQSIKTALRKIGADEDGPNSLQVIWTSLDYSGSNEGVQVSVQLSSPVEDGTLSQMQSGDEEVEGASKTFQSVETSMATLTVTLKSSDGTVLGTSESYDLAPICKVEDAMNPQTSYTHALPVAIVSPDDDNKPVEAAAAAEEKEVETKDSEEKFEDAKESEDAKDSSEEKVKEEEKLKEGEETKEKEDETKSSTSIVKPLATLQLKLIFKPSAKDQKEELYELLNKTSRRKLAALEALKASQSALTRGSSASGGPGKKSPAVKAGFLNKKKAAPEKGKIQKFYDQYLGPKSMARGVVVPIAKNYVIFVGAVILMHYQGQRVALPAPV